MNKRQLLPLTAISLTTKQSENKSFGNIIYSDVSALEPSSAIVTRKYEVIQNSCFHFASLQALRLQQRHLSIMCPILYGRRFAKFLMTEH